MLSIIKSYKTSITLQVVLAVLFLFACSQISIPLKPVPISLQTVGVILIALLYNMQSSMTSMVTYVTLGALGLPVFSNYGAGLNKLLGPTGGYIFGFIACAYIINKLKSVINTNKTSGIFLVSIIGTIVIFICGISWLSLSLGFSKAIQVGFIPFIIPGIIKAIALTLMLRIIKK